MNLFLQRCEQLQSVHRFSVAVCASCPSQKLKMTRWQKAEKMTCFVDTSTPISVTFGVCILCFLWISKKTVSQKWHVYTPNIALQKHFEENVTAAWTVFIFSVTGLHLLSSQQCFSLCINTIHHHHTSNFSQVKIVMWKRGLDIHCHGTTDDTMYCSIKHSTIQNWQKGPAVSDS